MSSAPKILILTGLALVGLGALLWGLQKIPGAPQLGRLPGDIRIEGKGYSFYFPIVTCIILSVLLTLILRFFRK